MAGDVIDISSVDVPAGVPAQKFGTFLGVFMPSVLTILGLVMYLRFGWVVGNVGLPLTFLIVLLASAITFITALSASSVATNMRIGVGGEYYMVSRSLGLELGGAIGIPLFLCRTLSITFYSFGLAESMVPFLPSFLGLTSAGQVQFIAVVVILIITLLSGKSAGLVLKLQIPIMIAVVLSIFALMAGVFWGGFRMPEMTASYRTAPQGFWYVFAVFFPAVTGFTAGIGMSGDLKDPQRSIPQGTILAVVAGTITYIIILILLAVSARISFETLAQPEISWTQVAVLGAWLVFPGIWGAILSSAFGSVLSGPRVLQALAHDGLAPHFLSRLSNTGQPTIATWISGALALAAVSLGTLNTVARFVSVLFLTLYVAINLSAALENIVSDPSYRPTINVPWYVALAGAMGAIAVMFLISPSVCVVAVILELALYLYLRSRMMKKQWGDVRAGIWMALARFTLLQVRNHESDPRNWRPHILLFSGEMAKRLGLVRLACWFNQDRGIVTACHIIVGDLMEKKDKIKENLEAVDCLLNAEGLVAFGEVNVVSEFESGAIDVIQANGIGSLRSNTVMFGWPKKPERVASILRIMHTISAAGKNTIIASASHCQKPGLNPRIDIWWRGLQQNGDLMLLLAYLLSLNQEWTNAKIILRSIVGSEVEKQEMTKSLNELVPESRIEAETEVIIKPENTSVSEVIHSRSGEADIVFLGLQDPERDEESEYAQRLIELVSGLKVSVFVRNSGKFAGNLI